MRLDWNDIKARAAKFAGDWNGAQYERGDTQTFYNEFFELFGVTRRRVASFEHGVNLPDKKRGYLDLFWKGKLLVEQKSADLDIAPDRPVRFRLPELPDHVQDFGFIAGQERRVFRDQDPVNILASRDEAVDRLYRKEPFASDRERVEHLFGLYEKLTAPMLVAAAAKPKRGRRK
ncbi:MAG: hypothetical protein M3178_01815 [Pseudomonadota bacterium]|nr:hypothetical protein [Pseudomonadota bacterium]